MLFGDVGDQRGFIGDFSVRETIEGCSGVGGGGVGSVWCPQKLQCNPHFGAAREAYSLHHICQDRRIVVATDGCKAERQREAAPADLLKLR
jgi:hypothetical protein